MEQFWFVVEARSLAREMESNKGCFEGFWASKKNTRELSIGEKCEKLPLSYDKVVPADIFDKVAGDNYEQRPTHIA